MNANEYYACPGICLDEDADEGKIHDIQELVRKRAITGRVWRILMTANLSPTLTEAV